MYACPKPCSAPEFCSKIFSLVNRQMPRLIIELIVKLAKTCQVGLEGGDCFVCPKICSIAACCSQLMRRSPICLITICCSNHMWNKSSEWLWWIRFFQSSFNFATECSQSCQDFWKFQTLISKLQFKNPISYLIWILATKPTVYAGALCLLTRWQSKVF